MNGNEVPLVRAIRGPITLITLGVLFALDNFTFYRFSQTWPVLLIVFGLLSLVRHATRPGPPPPGPAATPWTPPPSAAPPPGNYRESQYPGAPGPPSGGAA
jgi:cell wall-active antibiotic response 4TMS protein YvqF